jgi:hypothetical protein
LLLVFAFNSEFQKEHPKIMGILRGDEELAISTELGRNAETP